LLKEGGELCRSLNEFSVKGIKYPNGTFVINSSSINKKSLEDIAAKTNVTFVATNTNIKTNLLKKNRIALYKSWSPSMDAGWISLILERYNFDFRFLYDAEIRAGNLNEHYDIIILPDQGASSILNGNSKGSIHPDYVGGITRKGMENLIDFVENGGVLVCNENSCNLAISEFKLPVKNVLAKVKPEIFNCPGSIVKINYDTENPIAYGLCDNGVGYFSRSLAFEVVQDSLRGKISKESGSLNKVPGSSGKVNIIATYPDDPLLISGWMIGDEKIRKKAAIVEVPFEKGNIILYGFNFHNRAQSYSTFKLFFNRNVKLI